MMQFQILSYVSKTTILLWPISIHLPEFLSWYIRGPPESPAHGSWYTPFFFSTRVPNILVCLKLFVETFRLTLLSIGLCLLSSCEYLKKNIKHLAHVTEVTHQWTVNNVRREMRMVAHAPTRCHCWLALVIGALGIYYLFIRFSDKMLKFTTKKQDARCQFYHAEIIGFWMIESSLGITTVTIVRPALEGRWGEPWLKTWLVPEGSLLMVNLSDSKLNKILPAVCIWPCHGSLYPYPWAPHLLELQHLKTRISWKWVLTTNQW